MWYKLKRIMMRPNGVEKQVRPSSRLPSAYQEVERIGTSWSQWIDTWFVMSWVTWIQTETKIEVNTTSQNIPVFWCRKNDSSSPSSSTYCHLTPYSSKWYYWTNGTEKNAGTYNNTIWTQYTIIFNNSNNKISVNGTEIWDTSNATWYSSAKLAISRRWTNYSYDLYYWSWNYYYFNIYNRNTSTYERQMVPCYRKLDNVIGMYDLVNDVFYTNNGSWTFTKWPDV